MDKEGIMSRFGPHHGASRKLHWVRPGLMVAAAVTQQGSLEVSKYHMAHDMHHMGGMRDPCLMAPLSTLAVQTYLILPVEIPQVLEDVVGAALASN